MAACQMRCRECGNAFYGRADARYCGAACRQKAYRARAKSGAGDFAASASNFGDTLAQARRARANARAARERAVSSRTAASVTRAAIIHRPIGNQPLA